jgi:hypothetical protein
MKILIQIVVDHGNGDPAVPDLLQNLKGKI